MITGSMALEEDIVTEETTYTCTGQWDFGNGLDRINCWNHSGHGLETFVDGICNSCNPYMIWLGQQLGRQTFFNYFEAFASPNTPASTCPARRTVFTMTWTA